MSMALILLAMMGSTATDFGIRTVSGRSAGAGRVAPRQNAVVTAPVILVAGRVDLAAAAAVARSWGRVTSMKRSPEHNRRVGGVRNSFHLSGRAIDIARRSGVQHSQIDAAYRSAGYKLIESLDEGDHSHFAFASGQTIASNSPVSIVPKYVESWRIVYAPGASRR